MKLSGTNLNYSDYVEDGIIREVPSGYFHDVIEIGVGICSSEPDRTGFLIWRVPESFTFQTNDS